MRKLNGKDRSLIAAMAAALLVIYLAPRWDAKTAAPPTTVMNG